MAERDCIAAQPTDYILADILLALGGGGGGGALEVQGMAPDNDPAEGNPVQTGGVARDVLALSVYTTGDAVAFPCDETNGTLLVTQGQLARDDDGVTAWSPRSNVSNTPSIASAATALAANPNRKGWGIQNIGTNPLFVRFASGASITVFHKVLRAGTGADDGTGGVIDDTMYTGIVTIAGTSPRYTVYELT